LAKSQGKIQLSLRNPLYTKQQEVASVQENALYRGASAPAKPMQHSKAPKQIILTAPAPAPGYQVEVYRGDKKDVTKFDSQCVPAALRFHTCLFAPSRGNRKSKLVNRLEWCW